MCTVYDTFLAFFLLQGDRCLRETVPWPYQTQGSSPKVSVILSSSNKHRSEVFIQTHPTANEQSLVKTCYATFECVSLVTIIMMMYSFGTVVGSFGGTVGSSMQNSMI